MVRCERSEEENGLDIGRGLVIGLVIAIPFWVILGIVPALVLQHGPMEETISAALMIAAVCEMILVRPYVRTLWAGIRRYADFNRADSRRDAGGRKTRPAQPALGERGSLHNDLEKIAGRSFKSIEDLLRYVEPKSAPSHQRRRVVAPIALVRRSLALSALAGAYLQYYFLDVYLQISSLHSVTIFLPVTSMT